VASPSLGSTSRIFLDEIWLTGRFLIRLSLLGLTSALITPLTARGQVTFVNPPQYAGGPTLLVADYNSDGKPDLLGSDGTMQLGNGDGTFRTGTSVAGGVVAVADFNGDGKPDVLQVTTTTLLVLLGNGDGTFQSPISTTLNTNISAVIAGDVNGDGKADVLGLDTGTNSLVVYLSNGNGTFAAGVSYALGVTASIGDLLTFGDFNGDHIADVAVTLPGQELVLLGNGNGTFQAPKSSAGVANFSAAIVGDFNNDGKLDVIISYGSNGVTAGNVSLLLGNGDGTFAAPTTITSEGGSIATADLNGDGNLDLVINDAGLLVQVWLGNGNGTFSNTHSYPTNNFSTSGPAIADFNLDGKLDIASGGYTLLGNGDGTFQGWPAVPLPLTPGPTTTGDFDKNGTLDVAVAASHRPRRPIILFMSFPMTAQEI
jgi:hypothetical protein